MLRFYLRPAVPAPDDLCVVLSAAGRIPAVLCDGADAWRPRADLPPGDDEGLFLGEVDGRALWAVERPETAAEGWAPLRLALGQASGDAVKALVRAAELNLWRRSHKYCGTCGAPTRARGDQVAFECPSCGAEFWPRITPAVIMLVHRGDEILLARHARSKGSGVYSCLAGFVEAAETLEEAVAREVAEEVGVNVGQPTYVASQAWPFPSALMLAFFVPWVAGDPVPDGVEIEEAAWFTRDTLPPLPPALSVARRLVRTFYHDPDL